MTPPPSNDVAARAEGTTLARYLVGGAPPPEVLDRYLAAHNHLPLAPTDGAEAAVLAFSQRWPLFLGALDAACGIVGRDTALRKRLLVMTALLETTPDYADTFLPRHVGPVTAFPVFAANGIVFVAKLLLGLPLYALVSRGRS